MSRPTLLFAAIAAACVGGAGAYVLASGGSNAAAGPAAGGSGSRSGLRPDAGGIVVVGADRADLDRLGRLAQLPGEGSGRPRAVGHAGLRCMRASVGRRGGICLTWGGGSFGSLYSAKLLDANLDVVKKIDLQGAPTRARVSPDGRYAAATTFVGGHSYAQPGAFSTKTILIDLRTRKVVAELEKFTVRRDGKRIDAPDVNFWGVSFARDSNRFYATLATGGETYLIEGDLAARTARTLRTNVECPSLSPDGTRIAFKKVVGLDDTGGREWRLHVLDLRTMRETPLAETASVDDQAEWHGDRVLYGKDAAVWSVAADGSGRPARFAAGAESPSVVR